MKRIRIRRDATQISVVQTTSFSPRWKPYDIVRIAAGTAERLPDILTILSVEEDQNAREEGKVGKPGDFHTYATRSLLKDTVSDYDQCQLADVDDEYARYAMSFWVGALAKLRNTLEKQLKPTPTAEKQTEEGDEEWDDDVEEERAIPRTAVVSEEEDDGDDDYSDPAPRRRRR